jgi:hypothetical protein
LTRVTGAPKFISITGGEWRAESRKRKPDFCAETGERSRLFKLRRASKPQPGDVFLVLGDLEGAGDVRFEDLAEVTWCDHAPYAHDLAYRPVRWK